MTEERLKEIETIYGTWHQQSDLVEELIAEVRRLRGLVDRHNEAIFQRVADLRHIPQSP